MAKWVDFPYADARYEYTPATLKKRWSRLHRGDCEPFPKDEGAVAAWIDYHAGRFGDAIERGLAAGPAGICAASKAACVYAAYLETSPTRKAKLLQEAGARAQALQDSEPENYNAFYLYAFAIGRYSQQISVAKALAQGLGGKVRDALVRAIALQPKHADAHIALGAFHAEVVDKVGAMIANVTYGAKRDEAYRLFRRALELNPESAIARIEYANALAMLEGKKGLKEAEALYAQAAGCEPLDAMERLDVEAAREELA
ncbi:MAG: hypothetical protein M9885_01455 [Burkholderiaceae bacterium]|nr:hypothetical protein [Burkholderiaceae bacterium]